VATVKSSNLITHRKGLEAVCLQTNHTPVNDDSNSGSRDPDALESSEPDCRGLASVAVDEQSAPETPLYRSNCDSEAPARPVITVAEAAELLRFSKAHLLNVLNGRVRNVPALPHIRIGTRILIRRESLDRWLAGVESSSG
jgi:excisionase family DNA binding protein